MCGEYCEPNGNKPIRHGHTHQTAIFSRLHKPDGAQPTVRQVNATCYQRLQFSVVICYDYREIRNTVVPPFVHSLRETTVTSPLPNAYVYFAVEPPLHSAEPPRLGYNDAYHVLWVTTISGRRRFQQSSYLGSPTQTHAFIRTPPARVSQYGDRFERRQSQEQKL